MNTKRVILGTAGHIDHGKTALIKALTGIDTDRLKEEKERGMTIDLGFAHIVLPSGLQAGIVDVPGHERFVKTMVAGVGGIDILLFVIAADDGIMPQTIEHLEICEILGIKAGIIALTKTDLVDEEWRELIIEEIRNFTTGTFMENSPVIPVSAVKGTGLEELIHTIDMLAKDVEEKNWEGFFRLPIDRIFTMRGFGSVVTGTVISGSLKVADLVEILPSGLKAKVRGIQAYNRPVEVMYAGQRAAVNLQGVEKKEIERGEVLTHPDSMKPTHSVSVFVKATKSLKKTIKNNASIRFHIGTDIASAKLRLLDKDRLNPGTEALAHIKLEKPIVALAGDRFILRTTFPLNTIGGGEILDPTPPQKRRYKNETLKFLTNLLESNAAGKVETMLHVSSDLAIPFKTLCQRSGLPPKKLKEIIDDLKKQERVVVAGGDNGLLIHIDKYNELRDKTIKILEDYHKKFPLKLGMTKEGIGQYLPKTMEPKLWEIIIRSLMAQGIVVAEKERYRLSHHTVTLEDTHSKLKQEIETIYKESKETPPVFKDLLSLVKAPEKDVSHIIEILKEEGTLCKVKENLYFHKDIVLAVRESLIIFLKEHKEIDIQKFKEITNAPRKYTIPLIEYFDTTKVTLRIGEKRVLRERIK
ncbi:MAG: selenocysteine-specific translation elongation factor [Thermodesulfobacteriota bacterium]|nr:selenocysteine-specific translation elongation factor [Thermodesulfobacteriota bacterium]